MNCKKESDIFNLLSINGIIIPLDNIKIKNIKKTTWLKTLELCPKTIAHMKLLIAYIDRIGIFNKYDVLKISTMSSKKLDMIYAILRICNKIFTDYLNITTKIISESIKKLIDPENSYDCFYMDQLRQDIDFFISDVIGNNYLLLILDANSIRTRFVDFLKKTFSKKFYRKLFRRNKINDELYTKNENKFVNLVDKLIKFTKEFLDHNLDKMTDFLDKIFDTKSSTKILKEIYISLEKFDLENLFEDHCLELDIYSEHKLDFEFNMSQHYGSHTGTSKLVSTVNLTV